MHPSGGLMPAKSSEMPMACCGTHFCSMCSWAMLIWGILFLAAAFGYLAWDVRLLLGLGLAVMGLIGLSGMANKH